MTDTLLEQIKADRKNGTKGEFSLFAKRHGGDGYTIAVEAGEHAEFVAWAGFDWRRGCNGFRHAKADARRCKNIPAMEVRIMRDAETIKAANALADAIDPLICLNNVRDALAAFRTTQEKNDG